MIGMGTVVNVLAIVVGGGLGLCTRGGLKEHYQEALIKALGLCVLFIGGAGALAGMLTAGPDGALSTGSSLEMIAAVALGTLLGELLDLEGKLERLGIFLKEKAARGDESPFVEGFVTASLVVCVGAMAIVGSIQDGMLGDPSTLYTKAVLDALIIMVFASTYGKGAVFSALPVGVLQGSVTLCAGFLAPIFTEPIIDNLSMIGSMLIFCVGINLCFGQRFRVANMLPALVVGGVLTALAPLVGIS